MQSILISRTDRIGDVVLTLPVAGALKMQAPDCRIVFLGRSYTKDVIQACTHVDAFMDWSELEVLPLEEQVARFRQERLDTVIHVFPDPRIARVAAAAAIPRRIGTSRRWYHWLTCNHRVRLRRSDSTRHESQLNLALLTPLGIAVPEATLDVVGLVGLRARSPLPQNIDKLLQEASFHLVLHPRSKGSAREWPLEHYADLMNALATANIRFLLTGTAAEAADLDTLVSLCRHPDRVTNLCGQLKLPELMTLLSLADGMVGASTGPVHLAAALGTRTLGLYPPIRPMDSGRWGPLGSRAESISSRPVGACAACRTSLSCACMGAIGVKAVAAHITAWMADR